MASYSTYDEERWTKSRKLWILWRPCNPLLRIIFKMKLPALKRMFRKKIENWSQEENKSCLLGWGLDRDVSEAIKGTPISWYWHWDKSYSILFGSFSSISIRHGQNIVGECSCPYTHHVMVALLTEVGKFSYFDIYNSNSSQFFWKWLYIPPKPPQCCFSSYKWGGGG